MKLKWFFSMMSLFSSGSLKEVLAAGAVLIDVRTQSEYVGFHLKDAVNIPYDEIENHIDTIRSWQRPIVVYSTYGLRSRLAAAKLRKWGVHAVTSTRDQLCELLAST